MIDPASGPFLFDTSADSYLERSPQPAEREWFHTYCSLFPVCVSALTVVERVRGYAVLLERRGSLRRVVIEGARSAYLYAVETEAIRVLPLAAPGALIAAELMAACPTPPSPARRRHRMLESRQDRLSRWRFDILIAATALVEDLALLHNNPADFEFLRGTIERMPERFPGIGPLDLISVKRLAA